MSHQTRIISLRLFPLRITTVCPSRGPEVSRARWRFAAWRGAVQHNRDVMIYHNTQTLEMRIANRDPLSTTHSMHLNQISVQQSHSGDGVSLRNIFHMALQNSPRLSRGSSQPIDGKTNHVRRRTKPTLHTTTMADTLSPLAEAATWLGGFSGNTHASPRPQEQRRPATHDTCFLKHETGSDI